MHLFIKKNQKKLMAVFAVVLMVAFLIPTVSQQGAGHDPVYGTIDGQPLHASELQQARGDWDRLMRIRQYNYLPVPYLRLGENAVAQITGHPDLFCLLQREARNMGIIVTKDEVDTVMNDESVQIPAKDIVEFDRHRSAIANLLLVENALRRIENNIKISTPLSKLLLSQNGRQIKLNLVEFNIDDFKSQVKIPTTQQVQDQFSKWSQVEPGLRPSQENPFGVGYKYPNRVKLQYLAVKQEEVKKAIRAGKPEHEWLVLAYRYYRGNPQAFQTTAPTTRPIPSAVASTQPTAAGPTTRPFDEVKELAIGKIVNPQADKLAGEVISRILAQLNSDFVAFARAQESKEPTTAPVTSYGSAYTSFEYLQKLALDMQKQYGVLPSIIDIDQYFTRKDAASLPGIGKATVDRREFADQAVSLAAPFFPEEARSKLPVQNLWQPSGILSDAEQNYYLFRLTDARPAETPKNVSEVAATVTDDLIRESSLRVARTLATSLLDNARKTSLAEAAKASGTKVITTDYLANRPDTPILDLVLDQQASAQFVSECFRLLNDPNRSTTSKPMTTIDLPSAGKVVAVQIEDVRPMWTDATLASFEWQTNAQARQSIAAMMQSQWFNYESTVMRVKYLPIKAASNQ